MKIKLTIEVELEGIIDVNNEDQKIWLEDTILVGDGTLNLHSEDIGDTVGTIKKVSNLQYLENKESTASKIFDIKQ